MCKMYGYNFDNRINRAEQIVMQIVSDLTNFDYTPQKKFDWLRGVNDFPLFCDGYFPELNLVVEFDGRQHREPVANFGGEERFKVTQANDKIKDTLIPKHGLTLIRISSESNWHDRNYIESILKANNIPFPTPTS